MLAYTCVAIPTTPSWWPAKQAGATRDYSLEITSEIDPTVDFISVATCAVAPSGDGEMQPSGLVVSVVDGDIAVTVTMTGGVPSRVYTVMFVLTMSDGRVFEFFVYQGVPPGLPGYPVPAPPSPGFGTPITASLGTLINNNGQVNSTYTGFPITDLCLPPGAVWSNGGQLCIVPGATPSPCAALVLFSAMTAVELLALGGGDFPLTAPASGYLWNNNGVLYVA